MDLGTPCFMGDASRVMAELALDKTAVRRRIVKSVDREAPLELTSGPHEAKLLSSKLPEMKLGSKRVSSRGVAGWRECYWGVATLQAKNPFQCCAQPLGSLPGVFDPGVSPPELLRHFGTYPPKVRTRGDLHWQNCRLHPVRSPSMGMFMALSC